MRHFSRILVSAGCLLAAAHAHAFGLDDVAVQARDRAAAAYAPVPAIDGKSDYDTWRDLRFRPDHALWKGQDRGFQVQFFPAGGYHTRPVELFEIIDGQPRPLSLTRGDFVRGDDVPGADPAPMPLAGFRLHYAINKPEYLDEVIAFLGASYFRALGQDTQYGSSARGLAIDTIGAPPGRGEEFPSFVRFWLERPGVGAKSMVILALLDSPRASGAYRFEIVPGAQTVVSVQARLFLRDKVATLGIAPLTSMFWSGENQPVTDDFRPEIHDADGLQVASGSGEWLWRPLVRPKAPFATSFAMDGVKGFGLMQRDRRFDNYQDLEAHYQRRPSVWVEPVGDWGPGRVSLLELPARNESDDNMVAFWVPARSPAPLEPLDIAWRLVWADERAPAPPGARVVQTRIGHGYREEPPPPGLLQFHVDFAAAPGAPALPPGADVQAEVASDTNGRVLAVRTEPNPAIGGWRVTFDVQRQDPHRALELRAFLRHQRDTLSETWTYALPPQ